MSSIRRGVLLTQLQKRNVEELDQAHLALGRDDFYGMFRRTPI